MHEEVKNATLYINGKKITDENVTIYKRNDFSSYAELPFTKILSGIGFEVTWSDGTTAEIMYESKKFILDIEKISLTEYGDKSELIEQSCGNLTEKYRYLIENFLQMTLQ